MNAETGHRIGGSARAQRLGSQARGCEAFCGPKGHGTSWESTSSVTALAQQAEQSFLNDGSPVQIRRASNKRKTFPATAQQRRNPRLHKGNRGGRELAR